MASKEQIKQKEQEIINLARNLCLKNINEEYANLSENLIQKLGRKRQVPFETGNSKIWATAVVHALGTLNFLFDKSFLPFMTFDRLCSFYGTNKSTVGGKSLDIRKLLKLRQYDEDFSTEYIMKSNPWNRIGMTTDGLLFFDDDFEANEDESEIDEDDHEFDEDDLLAFEGLLDESLVDSVAIIVKPRKPFAEWINKIDPEDVYDINDFTEYSTYLVADEELAISDEEIEMLVIKNYVEIFKKEVKNLLIDGDPWPEGFDFDMFKDWFEYHVSTEVYNFNKDDDEL